MLALNLQPEFTGNTIAGTILNLNSTVSDSLLNHSTGDTFKITDPSDDLLVALKSCFDPNAGRRLIIGEQWNGQSYMLSIGQSDISKDHSEFLHFIAFERNAEGDSGSTRYMQ